MKIILIKKYATEDLTCLIYDAVRIGRYLPTCHGYLSEKIKSHKVFVSGFPGKEKRKNKTN